jgi:hypothetical protein
MFRIISSLNRSVHFYDQNMYMLEWALIFVQIKYTVKVAMPVPESFWTSIITVNSQLFSIQAYWIFMQLVEIFSWVRYEYVTPTWDQIGFFFFICYRVNEPHIDHTHMHAHTRAWDLFDVKRNVEEQMC